MKYRKIGGILTRKERKALIKSINDLLGFQKNPLYMILLTSSSSITIQGKLGFDKGLKDADFLINAQAIFDALTVNISGFYTPPFVDMPKFQGCLKDFTNAIKNSKQRLLDSAAQKKTAKTNLYGVLKDALAYVNSLAWDNLDAAAIITGAKMVVKANKTSKKQDFKVKQGLTTGEALIISLALMLDGKYLKATYYWQYSLDGGVTWIDIPQTSRANTTLIGMPAGVPAKFRKRTYSAKTGLSKWCTPIDFTVQ